MRVDIAPVQGLDTPASIEPSESRTVPREAGTFALSIIVPTRNEAGNIGPLLAGIQRAVQGLASEVIFVDDSLDDTAQVVRDIRSRFSMQVRLLLRPPERRRNGLGGAVIEGLRTARAPWACVMDADLQHPPHIIPAMLERAKHTGSDLVIGSRLAPGGDATSLGPRRRLLSRLLAKVARFALPASRRRVADPLSGLFLVRRAALDLDRLRPDGFKILLDLLARHPDLAVSELPFRFGTRHSGESKASVREALRFLRLVARLRLSTDPRFLRFAAVGASGLLVNSLALAAATESLGLYYLISVALATLVSSTWNFAFTEAWVFRDRPRFGGRLSRFLQFLAMNVGALLLRGPVVYLLTSVLGLHYLISNLVSLVGFTVARYLLSDRFVWRRGQTAARPAAAASRTYAYDIHGIVSVVSDAALPELEHFRTSRLIETPRLRVHLGRATAAPTEHPRMLYDEGLLGLGFRAEIRLGTTIDARVSPQLRWSPHVLYTNLVEPILRWAFVEKGYALVHGACLDYRGRAYLITARTDTGKTTTLLQILYRQPSRTDGFGFISDDLTLISSDGTVLNYPKPLTISRHTARAVDARSLSPWQRLALIVQSRVHSRSGRRLAHFLAHSRLPMATINAIVQFLVPPPKYHVQHLIPGVRLATRSRLAGMLVIERGPTQQHVALDHAEAVDLLVENSEDAYGFPPYDAIKAFLYGSNGHDLRLRERNIIARALAGVQAARFSSSSLDWWREIPGYIAIEAASHRGTAPSASSDT